MRRPTDGDAAYQLRLALRAYRVAQHHLRTAALDAQPRLNKQRCRAEARDLELWTVPTVLRLINEANAHVRQLRAAKRKAVDRG